MTAEVALAARITLASALLVSGVAKLLAGARLDALVPGLPDRWQPALARVVPVVELAAVIALLAAPWTPAAAWATVGLLAVFTVALFLALTRPEPVPCNCFGAMSERPVGGASLVRNGWLIALAVVATGTERPVHALAVATLVVAFGAITTVLARS